MLREQTRAASPHLQQTTTFYGFYSKEPSLLLSDKDSMALLGAPSAILAHARLELHSEPHLRAFVVAAPLSISKELRRSHR